MSLSLNVTLMRRGTFFCMNGHGAVFGVEIYDDDGLCCPCHEYIPSCLKCI